MNEMRPEFLENKILEPEYYAQPNPYKPHVSECLNLLELSRYARKCGKKLIELTSDEVDMFREMKRN